MTFTWNTLFYGVIFNTTKIFVVRDFCRIYFLRMKAPKTANFAELIFADD